MATMTESAVQAYMALKEKASYRWIIYKFSDDFTEVQVDLTGPPDSTFDDMYKNIPNDHVRYIVFSCEYVTVAGEAKNKVLLVKWSSDDGAPDKEKMVVTTTFGEVKRKCTEFARAATINDLNELSMENFINIVSDNRTK